MPYEIYTGAHYEHVLSWLQEHVGDLQWSRPIVEWKGQGWTLNSHGLASSRRQSSVRYIIRVDNAKLATLAALRWSS
jgi:hypothetical protein